MSSQTPIRINRIRSRIRTIHGKKVILDFDLAELYGVPTKALNQAVKRNLTRFPDDFIFQLTPKEAADLMRSQFVTASETPRARRSKTATAYKRNVRFLPYAFTENGAIMAANVLHSPDAVRMSVFVVRAFVKMRELLGGTKELAAQLAGLEKKLTARLDGHEIAIVDVLRRIMDILNPLPLPPDPPRRQIGFHVEPKAKAKQMKKA